jgi:hypothetical protein
MENYSFLNQYVEFAPEDSETEDENSLEIDYPDSEQFNWSDNEEDVVFFRTLRYRSLNPPVLRREQTNIYIQQLFQNNKEPVLPPKIKENITIKYEGDCCICLETLSNIQKKTFYCASRCGNVFHKNCLQKYIQKDHINVLKCPICRERSIFLPTPASNDAVPHKHITNDGDDVMRYTT